MAGHNKWSKVKHRKAVVDKRRSKAWTMCSRAIISAVRQHGPDPEFNNTLRQALDDARYYNVPKDNIDRAIKKGQGAGEGESYENVRYEGYGPHGVAIVIDALTNNRTRTASDLRLILGKHSGNLGTTGCVAFMFETKGRVVVSGQARDEEKLFEIVAGAGADDLRFEDDDDAPVFTIMTSVPTFNAVKAAVEAAKFTITEAAIEQVPTTLAELDVEQAKAVLTLVDALEDNEDVKHVYTNADVPDGAIDGV
ncbi:MAG: YebC/PmpR family DNA-binding transcriptional regulator [Phycisphaerales bacterium]|nr:YebC/PmpR family DNA-binding transcriptional regulator [Phycisphaerales bacterium]